MNRPTGELIGEIVAEVHLAHKRLTPLERERLVRVTRRTEKELGNRIGCRKLGVSDFLKRRFKRLEVRNRR
jgi:hypothetical protein